MLTAATKPALGGMGCATPRPSVPDHGIKLHERPPHEATPTATYWCALPASKTKSSASGEVGEEEFITPYDYSAIVEVLTPVSVVGWLLFGIICILCINGRGRLGRWVPEWYLDSGGTKRDKAAVGLWWVAVMVLWPAILPVLLVKGVVGAAKRRLGESRRRMEEKKRPCGCDMSEEA